MRKMFFCSVMVTMLATSCGSNGFISSLGDVASGVLPVANQVFQFQVEQERIKQENARAERDARIDSMAQAAASSTNSQRTSGFSSQSSLTLKKPFNYENTVEVAKNSDASGYISEFINDSKQLKSPLCDGGIDSTDFDKMPTLSHPNLVSQINKFRKSDWKDYLKTLKGVKSDSELLALLYESSQSAALDMKKTGGSISQLLSNTGNPGSDEKQRLNLYLRKVLAPGYKYDSNLILDQLATAYATYMIYTQYNLIEARKVESCLKSGVRVLM